MSAESLMDKYPAMSIDDVVFCSDIAEIFSNHGIDIPLPWEGDLDDVERERFNGLLAAIERVKATERERCAAIAFGFTVSAHIAHDMRCGNFPNRSEGREAIAAMIRDPGHPYSPSIERVA